MGTLRLKPRDRAKVHSQLYRLASRLLTRHKACATCKVGCPTRQYTMSWCCKGCPHLSPQGCTVEALACKLWLCYREEDRQREGRLEARLRRLQAIAVHYSVYVPRGSKEQALKYGHHSDVWDVYHGRVA